MPGQIEHGAVVDVDRPHEGAVGHVPELDRAVVPRGGERRPVGGEFSVVEQVAMRAERPHEPAGRSIANLRHAAQADDTTGDHELRSVAAEVHGGHRAREVGDRDERLRRRAAVLHSHDLHGAATGHGEPCAVGGCSCSRDGLRRARRGERGHHERFENRRVGGGAGGARRDPGLEDRQVGRRHLRLVGGRHVVFGGALDALDEDRAGRIARHDRITRAGPACAERREPLHGKVRLRLAVVVAAGAVGAQDPCDVAIVRNGIRPRAGQGDRNAAEQREQACHENTSVAKQKFAAREERPIHVFHNLPFLLRGGLREHVFEGLPLGVGGLSR